MQYKYKPRNKGMLCFTGMTKVEATVTFVQSWHKFWIISAQELRCETTPLLASSLNRYCKSWLLLYYQSITSKTRYSLLTHRTQALWIISVKLIELQFTHMQFFKCETIKNSLEQGNYKDARLIPCDRVTWHLASIRYFLALWTSRECFIQ